MSTLWYRARHVRQVSRDEIAAWLSDVETLRRHSGGPMESSGRRVFVKRHVRRLHKAVGDGIVLRKTPARRAFDTGLLLQKNGVRTARVLAAIERRVPGESLLVLEFVEGPHLRQHILEALPAAASGIERDRRKTELWNAVASAVARLHSARVRQRDLKAMNILIRAVGNGIEAVLVDLEGMQRLNALPSRRQRARDLARLVVSLRAPDVRDAGVEPADCERLVRLYLDACRATFPEEADLLWWADTILSWAERKEELHRRLGRPLE